MQGHVCLDASVQHSSHDDPLSSPATFPSQQGQLSFPSMTHFLRYLVCHEFPTTLGKSSCITLKLGATGSGFSPLALHSMPAAGLDMFLWSAPDV